MLEGHDAGRHGNAALALDLHPVRARAPVLATRPHLAGGTDRPAGQQQVLGQRRLAGVGVRDDGEGAPPGRLGSRGMGHAAEVRLKRGKVKAEGDAGRHMARRFGN